MMTGPTWHKPFSPCIMETTVSQKFIDTVNEVGDEVLIDDVKSTKWDWSHKLVGKVHKEVQIPITNKGDTSQCTQVVPRGLHLKIIQIFLI